MGKTKEYIYTEKVNEVSRMARVLASPARIAILQYISNSYECICNDLVQEIGLSQPTITQHLNELKKAGLVEGHYKDSQMYLCIVPDRWEEFKGSFKSFFKDIKPNGC